MMMMTMMMMMLMCCCCQTAEAVTSTMYAVMRHRKSRDDDSPSLPGNHCPQIRAERTSRGGLGSQGDGVTIHRCRSNGTLSDWRSTDRQSITGSRRHEIQLHRPPLSGEHRTAVAINRQDSDNSSENSGNVFTLSGEFDKSSHRHDRALGRHIVVV